MKKEIEELIEKKAKNILEKYYSNVPDINLNDKHQKIVSINLIKAILKKTLITSKRINILRKKINFRHYTEFFNPDYHVFFSPNFEEALKYLSPSSAFSLFHDSSSELLDDYCFFENYYSLCHYGIYPLYTRQELSQLYRDFTLFIENNSKALIETGWPKYNFTASPWLFFSFSLNYPIEIPAYILNKHPFKNAGGDPYSYFRDYFLKNSYKHKDGQDKMVSIIKYFSYKELGFLEDMRYKFLYIKKEILKEINELLFLDNTDKDLWFKNCLKIIFGNLSQNDLTNLRKIEKKYDKIRFYCYIVSEDLSHLIGQIVYIYNQTKTGIIDFEKEIHNSFLRKYKFANKEGIESFYQLIQIGKSENGENGFTKMLKELNKKTSEAGKKIKLNFIKDSINLYMKKYVKINYLLNLEYYPLVQNLINTIEEGKPFNLTLPFLRNISTLPLKRITPLELPHGTKWEHIVMQFIDNENITIKISDNSKYKANYTEMGFKDEKKLCPNIQWKFLHFLSLRKGRLSWKSLAEERNAIKKEDIEKLINQAKKRKQLLSKN